MFFLFSVTQFGWADAELARLSRILSRPLRSIFWLGCRTRSKSLRVGTWILIGIGTRARKSGRAAVKVGLDDVTGIDMEGRSEPPVFCGEITRAARSDQGGKWNRFGRLLSLQKQAEAPPMKTWRPRAPTHLSILGARMKTWALCLCGPRATPAKVSWLRLASFRFDR